MARSVELTQEEMLSIIKATVAYNQGKIEWSPDYLKYTGMLNLDVEREDDKITLRIVRGEH